MTLVAAFELLNRIMRHKELELIDLCKQCVYIPVVIKGFSCKNTEEFYTKGKTKTFPPQILKRASMRLLQLNAATIIDDLKMPLSNNLEALSGSRKGQYSIRINRQWRLCFRFVNSDAYDVEIKDYH